MGTDYIPYVVLPVSMLKLIDVLFRKEDIVFAKAMKSCDCREVEPTSIPEKELFCALCGSRWEDLDMGVTKTSYIGKFSHNIVEFENAGVYGTEFLVGDELKAAGFKFRTADSFDESPSNQPIYIKLSKKVDESDDEGRVHSRTIDVADAMSKIGKLADLIGVEAGELAKTAEVKIMCC